MPRTGPLQRVAVGHPRLPLAHDARHL
jgi:hypothetical protein